MTSEWLIEDGNNDGHSARLTVALQQARVALIGLDTLRDGQSVEALTQSLDERLESSPLHVLVCELAAAVVALAAEVRNKHEALPRRVDGIERALNSL
jgi:hypothetical protein